MSTTADLGPSAEGSGAGILDSSISVEPGSARAAAVTGTPTTKAWLAMVETWHGSSRHPGPILLDGAITAALAAVVTDSAHLAILCAAVLITAGLTFGLFKPRLAIEIQGVTWYPRPLLPTVGAVFTLLLTGVYGSTPAEAWQVPVLLVVGLTGVRLMLWPLISTARRHGSGLRPTLIIGPSYQIDHIEHRVRTFPEAGLMYRGCHVPTGGRHGPDAGRHLVDDLLGKNNVTQVLCVSDSIDEAVFRDVVRFGEGRVDVGLVLPVPGVYTNQTRGRVGDLAVIPIRCRPSWGSRAAKRTFDFVASSIGLVLVGPVFAALALAIRLSDGGPAMFCQTRVGRHGKTFKLYKFRSMVIDAEASRHEHLADNVNHGGLLFKVDNDPRITTVGRLLRRFSIDELPQLLNVVRGDMSLVGPRPLPVDPDEFDVAAQIRHKVAPGMTGLWQVSGGNALPYADMVDLDLTYVTTRSMGLDLVCLARTLPALIVRRSAY
jgi:lipopolysaccharide/colanic/teichoic acid biosynthesis glycosyltransferase